MPHPDNPSSTIRVFIGERLGSRTLRRAEAIAIEPYTQFFDVNGHFKQRSAIRPNGECVAPEDLEQN